MKYIIRVSILVLMGIAFLIIYNLKNVGVPYTFKLPSLWLEQEASYLITNLEGDTVGTELYQYYKAGNYDYFEIRFKHPGDTSVHSGYRLVTDSTTRRHIWSHFEVFRMDTSRWTGNDSVLSNGLYASFQENFMRSRNKIREEFVNETKQELPDTFLVDTRFLSKWNVYLKNGFPGGKEVTLLDMNTDSLKYLNPFTVNIKTATDSLNYFVELFDANSGSPLLKLSKKITGKSFLEMIDYRSGIKATRQYHHRFEYREIDKPAMENQQ
ncbi:MAG: hypothetical protein J0L62_03875 [Bacteroidetes bacterium]|nr:hypothetical protein [Bacteroidota bacterium]